MTTVLAIPGGAAVLQREQRRVHRARLGEAVLGEVLCHGVGRRQADHPPAVVRVRVADRRERVALAGAGAALDERQAATGQRMVERRLLIRPQRPPHQRQPRRRRRHTRHDAAGPNAPRRAAPPAPAPAPSAS